MRLSVVLRKVVDDSCFLPGFEVPQILSALHPADAIEPESLIPALRSNQTVGVAGTAVHAHQLSTRCLDESGGWVHLRTAAGYQHGLAALGWRSVVIEQVGRCLRIERAIFTRKPGFSAIRVSGVASANATGISPAGMKRATEIVVIMSQAAKKRSWRAR